MELNLPTQEGIPGVDTRPATLCAWLDALPYTEILHSARRIAERLRDINDQHLPPAHRMELMAAFRSAYVRLHDWLSGSPQADAYQALSALTAQMAFGYKFVVKDSLATQRRWSRPKHLAAGIENALRFLSLQLVSDYQAYRPGDPAVWSEINSLFGLAGDNIPAARRGDHLDDRLAGGHAGDIYKQIVLLRLGDPYRLPPGSVWEAFACLGKHASAASLTTSPADADTPGVFVLPPNAETSSITAGSGAPAGRHWLDARQLIGALQAQVEQLLCGARPETAGFSDRLSSVDGAQIITRLCGQWLHAADRRTQRFPSNQRIHVLTGLPAAYRVLNQGRAFDATDYAEPAEEDHIDFSAVSAFPASQTPQRLHTTLSTVRNRSVGGLSLSLPALEAGRLRVGQLIAIKLEGTQDSGAREWIIGIIRWLVQASDDAFNTGIQYVGRHVKPCAVRAVRGNNNHVQPALRTDLQHASQTLHTLIAPRGTYAEKRSLELIRGQESVMVRANSLIETNPAFERFTYVLETPGGI